MPKSAGGLIGWAVSTIIVVAVGVFILSRIKPLWRVIVAQPAA